MLRREVLFRGQVQGVGFRMTTQRIAQRWAVTGFVRNLSDGRVQLVVEGELAELNGFIGAVRQAMVDHIHDSEVVSSEASGTFSSFAIRH
jgi:acylphosphatase